MDFIPKNIFVSGKPGIQNRALVEIVRQQTETPCSWLSLDDFFNPRFFLNEEPSLILLDSKIVPHADIDHLIFQNSPQSNHSKLAFLNFRLEDDIRPSWVLSGLRGVFYEGESIEIFEKGVRELAKGELWFPRGQIKKWLLLGDEKSESCVDGGDCAGLTEREKEVLVLVSSGHTRQDIARQLCITPNTVKTHLNNAYKKIGVNNSLQATLWVSKYIIPPA